MKHIAILPIEVDESILLSLKESKEDVIYTMKLFTALHLYKKNRLSLGKAAEFVGIDKLKFIEILKEEGSVFDYNEDEIKDIIKDANELADIIQ